jgi:HPt (histidine-containing phosphotransfer) domain-containing protein
VAEPPVSLLASNKNADEGVFAMDPADVIDRAELWDRVDCDRQILADLEAAFREGGARLLADVVDALDLQDQNRSWRAAHALKGAVATLAARSATPLAIEIEVLAMAGELSSARRLCDQLRDELPRVQAALAAMVATGPP